MESVYGHKHFLLILTKLKPTPNQLRACGRAIALPSALRSATDAAQAAHAAHGGSLRPASPRGRPPCRPLATIWRRRLRGRALVCSVIDSPALTSKPGVCGRSCLLPHAIAGGRSCQQVALTRSGRLHRGPQGPHSARRWPLASVAAVQRYAPGFERPRPAGRGFGRPVPPPVTRRPVSPFASSLALCLGASPASRRPSSGAAFSPGVARSRLGVGAPGRASLVVGPFFASCGLPRGGSPLAVSARPAFHCSLGRGGGGALFYALALLPPPPVPPLAARGRPCFAGRPRLSFAPVGAPSAPPPPPGGARGGLRPPFGRVRARAGFWFRVRLRVPGGGCRSRRWLLP